MSIIVLSPDGTYKSVNSAPIPELDTLLSVFKDFVAQRRRERWVYDLEMSISEVEDIDEDGDLYKRMLATVFSLIKMPVGKDNARHAFQTKLLGRVVASTKDITNFEIGAMVDFSRKMPVVWEKMVKLLWHTL